MPQETEWFTGTNYGRVARIYNALDALHYGGIGRRSSAHFLKTLGIQPCSPLVPACGTGLFAVDLVETLQPPELTINDIDNNMLAIATERLKRCHWSGALHVIPGDITVVSTNLQHDLIALNYVLSTFDLQPRAKFLDRVLRHTTEKAVVMVADYDYPKSPFAWPFYVVNWLLSVAAFMILTNTKPNALGNFEQSLVNAGLTVERKKTFLAGLYAAYVLRKGITERSPIDI